MAKAEPVRLQLDNDALDRLLSAMHGVEASTDESESPIHVRLRYLQKLGFPAGANAGRGRRATHDADGILQTTVAFELLKVGLSPKRAAATVAEGWDTIMQALRGGWRAWCMASTGTRLTDRDRVRVALARTLVRVSQRTFDDAADAMTVLSLPFLEGEEAEGGGALIKVGDPLVLETTEITIDTFGLIGQLHASLTKTLRLRDEDVDAALGALLGKRAPARR